MWWSTMVMGISLWINLAGRPEGLPRLSFAKDSMNLLHGTIYNLTLEKMY